MNLRIEFSMDNAAFDSDPSNEAARILRRIADQVADDPEGSPRYDKFRTVFDSNGNDVGRWRIDPETEALLERRA
jgi:hypothetical protein